MSNENKTTAKATDIQAMIAEAVGAGMGEAVKGFTDGIAEAFKGLEIPKAPESGQASVKSYEGIIDGAVTRSKSGALHTEPGIKMARFFKLTALQQRMRKDGEHVKIGDLAEKQYAFDSDFVAEIKQISVTGDGQYLVPEDYANEIIPLLYPNTAVMKLGARIVPMPHGNLNIPKLISGSSAGYIGENRAKNASKPIYRNVKLNAKKLSNVVPISNDILRSTTYVSDQYVRDDMVIQMQLAMDNAAIQGSGSEFAPLGIVNTPGVQKSTLSALPTTENTYLQVNALEQANSKMISPGWIFNATFKGVLYNLKDGDGRYLHREELQRGLFHGFPYVVSNQITTGTTGKKTTLVIFGDFSEWLIGEQMQLQVKMSEDASYLDESGDLVSAFALDQTVMNTLMLHDMAASHGEVFTAYTYDTIA